MFLISALALLLSWPAQQEKKPAPEAPQEEKKPQEKPEAPPAPQEPPPEQELPTDLRADLRVGGWRTGTFSATTPLGLRKIESTLLFDIGLDLQVVSSEWCLQVTADYASSKAMKIQTAGLLFGGQASIGSEAAPLDLQVVFGPIFGRLDVDTAGFGDFKSAVGFEARIAATSWLHERIGLSLWLDYRQIAFKFEETVLSGDERAGGVSFAVGAGLVMRF